jgi:hypothetical protein
MGLGFFVLVLVAPGCATDTLSKQPGVVRAPAGKCWSGAIGDSTKEGCGAKSFTIKGENIIVAVVQKKTAGRWALRLQLIVDGKLKDNSQTSATYGVAQVSE